MFTIKQVGILYGMLGLASATPARTTSTVAGRVEPTGSMTAARAAHTATLLPNGKVLIAGGMVGNGSFLASAELYDPATGRFTPTASMHTARVGHRAVLLSDGQVLVFGGGRAEHRELAEIYDPATAQWKDAGQIHGDFLALLRDGTLLISGTNDSVPSLRSTATYDPKNGRITPAGTMSSHLYGPATLLNDGRVLVAGGEDQARMYADAELFDPATRRWTQAGTLRVARDKHAAVRLADGRVLVVGGADKRGWQGQMASTEIYDPGTGSFSIGPTMGSMRFKLQDAVTVLPNGQVLIAGGSTSVEMYDPTTETIGSASGSLDRPRFFSTVTTLQDGRALIAGGYAQGTIASTEKAWVFKGSPAASP